MNQIPPVRRSVRSSHDTGIALVGSVAHRPSNPDTELVFTDNKVSNSATSVSVEGLSVRSGKLQIRVNRIDNQLTSLDGGSLSGKNRARKEPGIVR